MSTPKAARGIQSIEVGGQLLQALLRAGRPLPLKELAQRAGMTPAKAHPYLVSFGRLGLVAQGETYPEPTPAQVQQMQLAAERAVMSPPVAMSNEQWLQRR